jgi:hypothetical protein
LLVQVPVPDSQNHGFGHLVEFTFVHLQTCELSHLWNERFDTLFTDLLVFFLLVVDILGEAQVIFLFVIAFSKEKGRPCEVVRVVNCKHFHWQIAAVGVA